MAVLSPARRLLHALRAFRASRRANVTVTFALALVPIVGSVGAAVDYSRANAVKVALQAAADSTVLMLSKEVGSLNQAQLQSKGLEYFQALFTHPSAEGLAIDVSYSQNAGAQLVLEAATSVPTEFMGIVGIKTIPVGVLSQAKWGNAKLRVALVLDTTGSMTDDNKIGTLKTATKDLLDQLKSAATNEGDVYVSIIPFSKNVNLGPAYFNAGWIGWDEWEAEPATAVSWIKSNASTWAQTGPGSPCPFTNNTHGFRCATTPTGTTITNTIPSSGPYAGYICPSTDTGSRNATRIGIMYNGCYNSAAKTTTVATGAKASCGKAPNCSCEGAKTVCTQTVYNHTWIKNAKSTWNGCVTDRGTSSGPSSDFDRKVDAPGSSEASKYPAEQNSYCSPAVMGLNANWTAMKSMVDGLYPLGATNQPIGLVWGWQSLVGGGPFTVPPKDPNYQYQEVIILMSDGLNTLNRWSGNGYSTSTAVDRRMVDTDGSGTCSNAKAAGMTIYAIHFNTDGDPMSQLLKDCASGPDKFWMVTSNNEFIALFNALGTNLTKLRLAK